MEPETKSSGASVGLVIIIIILIVGGLYTWQSSQNRLEKMQDSQVGENSEELNSLEAELDATDTSTGVDVETVY